MKNITNIMQINDVSAVISFDPEIEMFRGEFIGLNGGADFYADNIKDLKAEGEVSLKVFLDMCKEEGIEPYKSYSGKFNARVNPDMHQEAVIAAKGEGISLNNLVEKALDQYLHA